MGSVTPTQAASIALFDYGFNIDSNITLLGDTLPAEINASGFDFTTGLGSISINLSGAGTHTVDAFFDHDIDTGNNTHFNETAFSNGVAIAGQSWEMDEPGYVNGDIYDNFQDSLLDNGIGTSIYGNTSFPEDVSMAMGWDFLLAANETALINLLLSDTAPTGGFFLIHSDSESDNSIYLSSSLSITAVPVTDSLWLMISGLLGLVTVKRKALRGGHKL
ncbi:MAG: hypothetical protein GQ582_11735 [Methyloprofundus sp.]|nr:hypothetical protein [Methyloprofundus sp.]